MIDTKWIIHKIKYLYKLINTYEIIVITLKRVNKKYDRQKTSQANSDVSKVENIHLKY